VRDWRAGILDAEPGRAMGGVEKLKSLQVEELMS
jgi:hypothetical protein